jgi:hypothetical protein
MDMKTLEKIVTNPLILIVIMANNLIEIGQKVLNIQTAQMSFDWFDFIIKLIIAVSLWLVLKAYFKLKNDFNDNIKNFNDKMSVFNEVSHIRNKRLFVRSFENIEYFRVPNETEQELWERLPAGGLFRDFHKEEYKIVREVLQKKMKNKSIEEIEKLLSEYYPLKNNKNDTKR